MKKTFNLSDMSKEVLNSCNVYGNSNTLDSLELELINDVGCVTKNCYNDKGDFYIGMISPEDTRQLFGYITLFDKKLEITRVEAEGEVIYTDDSDEVELVEDEEMYKYLSGWRIQL